MYTENTSDAWHIPQHPTRKHCITSIYSILFYYNYYIILYYIILYYIILYYIILYYIILYLILYYIVIVTMQKFIVINKGQVFVLLGIISQWCVKIFFNRNLL